MKYEEVLVNVETIEEALKVIPGLLRFESKFPRQQIDILRDQLNEIIVVNKEIFSQRFLNDITDMEERCLKKIRECMGAIEQADFDTTLEQELSPLFVNTITEAADKLSIRVNRATKNDLQKSSILLSAPKAESPESNSDNFSSVCLEYVKERTDGGNWERKTLKAYEVTFNLFTEIVGDLPMNKIDATACRNFKTNIKKLPKNHSKDKRYRDLPVNQVLNQRISKNDLLSTESVNKHIGRLSSLMNWSCQNGYVDKNYASGMQIRTSKSSLENRQPFSVDDLNKLFDDPIYTKGKMLKPYYFWLPLIALYSGARIQEICQLELKDIYEIDDILVFDINDTSATKRLKNSGSKRIIPVHSTLKSIGLERYISHLKKYRKKVLFPELTTSSKGREGQSQPASKWFARYKTKHGFKTDGIKAFHSFRHTFVDELKRHGTPEHISAALIGHSHSSITYGTYGGENTAFLLSKHLQVIEYSGFDLGLIHKPFG